MAITRKTDTEIGGPWLLDKDALFEFDKIIDGACDRFDKSQKKEIARVIRAEHVKLKSTPYYERYSEDERKAELKRIRSRVRSSREFATRRREIVVHFKSDKKVPPVTTFAEAVSHPDMTTEVATRFDFTLVHGTSKAEVRLSTFWSDRLQINVSPSDGEGCYELFVELHQWAERNRPHPVLVRWRKYSGLHWFLVFLCLYFITVVAGAARHSANDGPQAQARAMLADGFTAEQDHQAIELLLAMSSGYVPEDGGSNTDIWFVSLCGGVLLVGVIFSFSPRSRLAIGKGANSIALQRLWIQVVSKWLIGGIVLSLITAYFRSAIAGIFGF